MMSGWPEDLVPTFCSNQPVGWRRRCAAAPPRLLPLKHSHDTIAPCPPLNPSPPRSSSRNLRGCPSRYLASPLHGPSWIRKNPRPPKRLPLFRNDYRFWFCSSDLCQLVAGSAEQGRPALGGSQSQKQGIFPATPPAPRL